MPKTPSHNPKQSLNGLLKLLLSALAIAVVIRSFVIQPYLIPSESMLNALVVGDRLSVTKFSYGIHLPFVEKEILSTGEPERGDIIVFPAPRDKGQDFIKRVVGIPDDVIEIRSKQLFRNGEPVQEEYAIHTDPDFSHERDTMRPMTVPPGKVFVMGDNRDNSLDSRFWGLLDKDTIHGKALVIYWSSAQFVDVKWDHIGWIL